MKKEAVWKDICPNFAIIKIAENEFTKERLLRLNNLIAALFLIENSPVANLEQIIDEIRKILLKEKDENAVKRFVTWLRNYFEKKFKEKIDTSTWESKDMSIFSESVEKFREDSEKSGAIKLIIGWITQNLGECPQQIVDKMQKLRFDVLERFGAKVTTCQSLDEVITLLNTLPESK